MAGTVADILDLLPIFDNELEVGSGDDDESRAIQALTIAQHQFEAVAAVFPRVFQTAVTVTTTASTETSTWNTDLLRLDGAWLLDANSKPIRELDRLDAVGSHAPSLPWPIQLTVVTSPGAPVAYYANTTSFYWLPLPDATHTIRLYGLVEQTEFVDRTSTVYYPLRYHSALANFTAKLLRISQDDDARDLEALAFQIFRPTIRQARRFDRTGPRARDYTRVHLT